MSFEEFAEDDLTRDAVLRNFTVIGEVSSKLSEEFIEQYPNFPIKEAIAMRNKVVHDYGDINLDVVWATIKEDLPTLRQIVTEILRK